MFKGRGVVVPVASPTRASSLRVIVIGWSTAVGKVIQVRNVRVVQIVVGMVLMGIILVRIVLVRIVLVRIVLVGLFLVRLFLVRLFLVRLFLVRLFLVGLFGLRLWLRPIRGVGDGRWLSRSHRHRFGSRVGLGSWRRLRWRWRSYDHHAEDDVASAWARLFLNPWQWLYGNGPLRIRDVNELSIMADLLDSHWEPQGQVARFLPSLADLSYSQAVPASKPITETNLEHRRARRAFEPAHDTYSKLALSCRR
ncbi:MAG: hypothetical protein U0166_00675 [Acidobacteriota bacterium]